MRRGLILIVVMAALAVLALAMGSKEAREKKVHPEDSTSAQQGIAGKVEILEGNFMPMVSPSKVKGQTHPGLNRRVRAYLPVKMEGGMASALRDSIPTAMVAETVTDSAGAFFMPTPPGTFSVFVEENHGWYFNGWSGDGVQGEVTVDSGKTAIITIKVTTKATY
jgi:hypothetical protein